MTQVSDVAHGSIVSFLVFVLILKFIFTEKKNPQHIKNWFGGFAIVVLYRIRLYIYIYISFYITDFWLQLYTEIHMF
jgi:hypothetical protein